MTELEVGKKYWFEGEITQVDEGDIQPCKVRFGGEDIIDYIWMPESVEIAEAIPEREKVAIPNFVAEWIEECKNNKYHLSVSMQKGIDSSSQELSRWLFGKNNQDTFARAWLDGYEIEKEPLGVLLVDMPEESTNRYFFMAKNKRGVFYIDSCLPGETVSHHIYTVKVTEAEAKEKYPNFKWVSLEELGE